MGDTSPHISPTIKLQDVNVAPNICDILFTIIKVWHIWNYVVDKAH